MNILRIILGIVLITPAIVFSYIAKPNTRFKEGNFNLPWTNGFIKNVIKAYKRYSYESWCRRLISVFKNPKLVDQYFKILFNKQFVLCYSDVLADLDELIPSHDVQTDHEHHRQRVNAYKCGQSVKSVSPIIVVGDIIHDGHHRVAAMKEAGIKRAWVRRYVAF